MVKALRNQKGITLIELLAVIVIIGIIAAIAVPAIGATIKNSEEKADDASVAIIEDTAIRYAMDKEIKTATDTVTIDVLVQEGYLNELPTFKRKTNYTGTTVVTITKDPTNGNFKASLPGSTTPETN